MTRDEVLESIQANVENENLIKHMLATEAIMRALARRLGENVEEWGITGLLHDIDMELTEGDMSTHSRLGFDLVREMAAHLIWGNALFVRLLPGEDVPEKKSMPPGMMRR